MQQDAARVQSQPVKNFLIFVLMLGFFFITIACVGELHDRGFASEVAHAAKLSAQLHAAQEERRHLVHHERDPSSRNPAALRGHLDGGS